MVERSDRFATVAEGLGRLLSALESGERRLTEVSGGLAKLLLTASGSLPEVERKVLELTTQLANAVRDNQHTVDMAIAESASAVRQAAEAMQRETNIVSTDLADAVRQNQQAVGSAMQQNADAIRVSLQATQNDLAALNAEFGRQLTNLAGGATDKVKALGGVLSETLSANAEAIRKSVQSAQDTMASANGEFNRQIGDLTAKSRDQIKVLDDALRSQLTESLRSLAGQLAALSQQFVNDYRPLTDRLREVVRIAERLGDRMPA